MVGVGYLVLVSVTIGAPLVCAVGVGLLIYQVVLAARQFSRLRRGRYALTDQRVVVVYDRRTPEMVQSALALLGPPLVHVDPDGVGTIAFDRTPILRNGRWHRGGGGPRMAGAPYLYRVAGPEQAADLILAAQEKIPA